MSVEFIKKDGKKAVIQVSVELDDSSMLSSEEQIQKAVNDLGGMTTKLALEQFDTKGETIMKDGEKLSSKGKQKKTIKRPTER